MPKPKKVHKNHESETYSMEFDSYAELDSVTRILEEWDKLVDNLMGCGEDLCRNGEALREFGGESRLEGRLRILVGGELQNFAQSLVLQARANESGAMLSQLDAMVEQIVARLLREQPEEFLAMIEECPAVKPDHLQEEYERKLRQSQTRLTELDQGGIPRYDGELIDVERELDFAQRVLTICAKHKSN